jgi:hypothetical protein
LLSREELVLLILQMAQIQADTRQALEELLSRLPHRTH